MATCSECGNDLNNYRTLTNHMRCPNELSKYKAMCEEAKRVHEDILKFGYGSSDFRNKVRDFLSKYQKLIGGR